MKFLLADAMTVIKKSKGQVVLPEMQNDLGERWRAMTLHDVAFDTGGSVGFADDAVRVEDTGRRTLIYASATGRLTYRYTSCRENCRRNVEIFQTRKKRPNYPRHNTTTTFHLFPFAC
jgi:hypothetical protein